MQPFGSHVAASGSSPTPIYSPWRGRGGNGAVFVLDVLDWNLSGAGAKLRVTVQTKNSEDADATGTSQDVASIEPSPASVPTAPVTKYMEGFKEMYRYRVEVTGDSSDDWVRYRMLAPSWLPN